MGSLFHTRKDHQFLRIVSNVHRFLRPNSARAFTVYLHRVADRSGQSDITQDVISVQTCSSEDNKSLNVEQTHDRSGQLDKHIVAAQNDPEVCHEIQTLNTDNETIRERIDENMDFKIPGLPHSVVKQAHSASVRD